MNDGWMIYDIVVQDMPEVSSLDSRAFSGISVFRGIITHFESII